MSVTLQSKNEILSEILAKYNSIVDSSGNIIDTSKGSMVWINSVVFAEIINMLKSYINYVGNQALPNLPKSSHQTLLNWCSLYKITLTGSESDAEILELIYNRIQYPPSGGNNNDWVEWVRAQTLEITNTSNGAIFNEEVSSVNVVEGLRTTNSIDVIVVSNVEDADPYVSTIEYEEDDVCYNGSLYRLMEFLALSGPASISDYSGTVGGTVKVNDTAHGLTTGDNVQIFGTTDYDGIYSITKIDNDNFYFTDTYTSDQSGDWRKFNYTLCSSQLLAVIEAYCEEKRPLGIWNNEYTSPTIVEQNIELDELTYTSDEKQAIEEMLIAWINSKSPGEDLYISEIYARIYELGYQQVIINSPASDVTIADDEKILCLDVTFT